MTEIVVRVADLAAAAGEAVLLTLGLGSCVACVLHDPVAGAGGIAHVLLPSKTLARDHSNPANWWRVVRPWVRSQYGGSPGREPRAKPGVLPPAPVGQN